MTQSLANPSGFEPTRTARPPSLFVDDLHAPPDDGQSWAVVRSSAQAIAWMIERGPPEHLSLDHDLGGDDTAMILVHWMIDRDLDAGGTWWPARFSYVIHSANPVGSANLKGLLDGYLREIGHLPRLSGPRPG